MKRTITAILAAAATFASAIGLVATGGWLISEAALRPPLLTLQVAIVSVRAFGIARGSFRWIERVASHDVALRETVERRAHLWLALAKAGPRGAWGLRRGDAITRVMQDAEVLQDRVTRVLVPAVAALVTAAGAAALQWHLAPGAGLAFLVALVIAGGLLPFLTHRIERAAAVRALTERARLNTELAEFVAHRDELRALGLIDDALARIAVADGRRLAIESRAATLSGVTQWFAMLASGLAVVAGLAIAVPAVLDGRLQGPHLAVVALLPWSASEVVTALALAATAYVRVRSAADRLAEIEGIGPAIPPIVDGASGLHLRNVRVRWTDTDVVRDITLDVLPGQRVAIVGPSGAGKSSIVSAVLGLVEYEGEIAAGGTGSRAHRITAVPQSPHVFRTTMRENLRMAAGEVADEALVAALASVGLGAIPLDRDLGSEPLSGGEALRLGLARALLVDAPVVVLDEPAEHLDDETATRIMATIREALRDQAVLVTTHRLTDLGDFDRVHVLENGTIMWDGTFEECRTNSGWFRASVEWRLDKAQVD